MPRKFAIACLMLLAFPVRAEERRFTLSPGPVQLEFRAFGLGLLPIIGGFTRFSGTLALDGSQTCRLKLEGDAASLRMPSQSMTDDALSKDLLDVVNFPRFTVEGTCNGKDLAATLLMHGVARPVIMGITRTATAWTATGTIDRREWGMGARPLLAGPEVRLTIIAGLPPESASTPR